MTWLDWRIFICGDLLRTMPWQVRGITGASPVMTVVAGNDMCCRQHKDGCMFFLTPVGGRGAFVTRGELGKEAVGSLVNALQGDAVVRFLLEDFAEEGEVGVGGVSLGFAVAFPEEGADCLYGKGFSVIFTEEIQQAELAYWYVVLEL